LREKKASHKSDTNESIYESHTEYTPKQEDSQEIINAQSRATLEKIYLDLRTEIKQKDDKIAELSEKLGQAQEIAKNSVSLVEFKKSQFLLEESK